MNKKELDITINEDGTISIDQIGWEGKGCDGAIDDLIKVLGKVVKTKRKQDFFKEQKIKISQNQKWTG